MVQEELPSVRFDFVHLPGKTGGALWLLRPEGGIDSAEHPLFDALAQSPPPAHTVAVDLTSVHALSVRGTAGLVRRAEELVDSGRALYLVVPNSATERALEASGTARVARVAPSVQDVVEACTPRAVVAGPAGAEEGRTATGARRAGARPAGTGLPEVSGVAARNAELETLRAEVRHLRAKVRTHPLIDQALGVLLERYGLPGPRTAFDLLRKCSEVHNIRLRVLAAALVADPRGERVPEERRKPAPRLSFLRDGLAGTAHRGTVVNAVLDRTLDVAGTGMGSVRLAEPVTGGLRLEAHEGLSEELVDFLERSGEHGTPCVPAGHHRTRVTIADVATCSAFGESARAVLLAGDCRAVHCTPLTNDSGSVGLASAHMSRPGRMLTSGQARALDEMGSEAGEWLTWHHRTVVRDALRDLHLRAPSCRAGAAACRDGESVHRDGGTRPARPVPLGAPRSGTEEEATPGRPHPRSPKPRAS